MRILRHNNNVVSSFFCLQVDTELLPIVLQDLSPYCWFVRVFAHFVIVVNLFS